MRIQAVRGIAALGDARGGAVMRRLITSPRVDQNLQLEAITALAQLRDPGGGRVADRSGLRAVAVGAGRGAATRWRKTDVDTFISAISGLDPDAHWSVRAALATDARRSRPRARAGAADGDAEATATSA